METFEISSQGKILKGVLHLPKIDNPPVVIGSHGLEGTKSSAKQCLLSLFLPEAGIAFLRFDHQGRGESQGDFFHDTSLDKRSEDMLAALEYLKSSQIVSGRVALFGSSLGGSTCIETWHRLTQRGEKPLGIVICAAPVISRTIKNIPLDANGERPALPLSFFEKNLLFDITSKAAALDHLLVFHGTDDEIVPVENALQIFNRAKDPKRLILHPMGDHRMSLKKHQEEFEKETLAWFKDCFT